MARDMQGESFKACLNGSMNEEEFQKRAVYHIMIIRLFIWLKKPLRN